MIDRLGWQKIKDYELKVYDLFEITSHLNKLSFLTVNIESLATSVQKFFRFQLMDWSQEKHSEEVSL